MNFARSVVLFVILISSFVITSIAQEDTPSPEKRGVQLMFVPPPMEGGTISLGIYDPAGKLVRVLHQEAQPTDFFAALNGFITYWDGKDDSGKLMPAGKYLARGYMVGPMDFEGVAFLGNDWIYDPTAMAMRLKTITAIAPYNPDKMNNPDSFIVQGKTPGGKPVYVLCDADGHTRVAESPAYPSTELAPTISNGNNVTAWGEFNDPLKSVEKFTKLETAANTRVSIAEGKASIRDGDKTHEIVFAKDESVVASCDDRTTGAWAIVKNGPVSEVREYSSDGEFLRRLAIPATEPQPVKIAASKDADIIFLLEQNEK
ncbi:MAG: hypothetical protein WCD79_03390, partial [Chthoniobacteraceae bacterium]